jgi:hypothetical protein
MSLTKDSAPLPRPPMTDSLEIAKASISFIEGFLKDIEPFRNVLEALGYVDEHMRITPKGKKLLEEHWEKELKL